MLLKDTVFVLWINNLKCSLKTSVNLVLATEHLELSLRRKRFLARFVQKAATRAKKKKWMRGRGKGTKERHHSDLFYRDMHLSNTDTPLCPFCVRIRDVQLLIMCASALCLQNSGTENCSLGQWILFFLCSTLVSQNYNGFLYHSYLNNSYVHVCVFF